MKDYQERRRAREFFASRTVLIVLFFAVIGTGLASFRAIARSWEIDRDRQAAERRVQELNKKQEEAGREIEDFKNGSGIEREAREKLNFRKPGEEVVIIREEERPSTDADNEAQAGFIKGFFLKIFSFFGL